MPGVSFGDDRKMTPITGIETIEKARWKLTCTLCKQKNVGACIQCADPKCATAVHVTCAQKAQLFMSMTDENDDVEVRISVDYFLFLGYVSVDSFGIRAWGVGRMVCKMCRKRESVWRAGMSNDASGATHTSFAYSAGGTRRKTRSATSQYAQTSPRSQSCC